MADHYRNLAQSLVNLGFLFRRQGEGRLEVWRNRQTLQEVTFDRGEVMKSRAGADAVLAAAQALLDDHKEAPPAAPAAPPAAPEKAKLAAKSSDKPSDKAPAKPSPKTKASSSAKTPAKPAATTAKRVPSRPVAKRPGSKRK